MAPPHPPTLAAHQTASIAVDTIPYVYQYKKVKTMTRKHFKAIAEAIRQNIISKEEREICARALLSALKASNPNLDQYRFMDAAGG